MAVAGIVFNTFFTLIVLVGLFYTYRWFSGSGDTSDVIVYSSTTDGLPGKSNNQVVFSGGPLPQLYAGGEYSISTWIYVTNWGVNKGYNKPFLVLSGGASESSGYMTMVMYLGQFTNKLGVRVSYSSAGTSKGKLTYTGDYNNIVSGMSPYTDSSADFSKCDVESIDIQKWVNITAVLSGRTIDIYIDGKLSRSCLLDGLFMVDGDKTTIKLGGPNGFGGIIGMTRAANVAYSPDTVYSYYQAGPFQKFSLASLDPTQYSFDVKKQGSIVFSTG
jgi:hypothetical protein